jgi:hypothetical protein
LTILSITPSLGGVAVVPVVDTDFLLAGLGGYEAPYRKILLGHGTPTRFGHGNRLTSVTGTWSYPYRTRLLAVTMDEALDASETVCDVSGLTDLSPGMTILVDSEQMYVLETTPDASQDRITVERGVNGTTAATHLTAAPITRYVYDASVHTLALRLAEKRWKARDQGADGSDGGGDVGTLSLREGEDTVIRRMIGATVMLTGHV